MTERATALRRLAVGDFFHARRPDGASLICLVTAVSESTIYARQITGQVDREFDRKTGIEQEEVPGKIDCVTPFPIDIHNTLLGLDRRGQKVADMGRNGIEPDIGLYKLTEAEKQAFRLIDRHVLSHPLED